MGIIRNVLAVIIPGAGRLLRKKYLSGALVMMCWLVFVDAYFLLRIISPAGVASYVGPAPLVAFIAVFAANAINEVLHLKRARRNSGAGGIDELYSKALAAFVAGDDLKADDLLKAALRNDDINVDCLFLRAQVAARLGRNRAARKLLRKCRDFDENGKWKSEIEAASGRLQ